MRRQQWIIFEPKHWAIENIWYKVDSMRVADTRVKLPAWIVSNSIRISSVLYADRKLVYKSKTIQYGTAALGSIETI